MIAISHQNPSEQQADKIVSQWLDHHLSTKQKGLDYLLDLLTALVEKLPCTRADLTREVLLMVPKLKRSFVIELLDWTIGDDETIHYFAEDCFGHLTSH